MAKAGRKEAGVKYRKTTLDSGLRVVTAFMPQWRSVSVGIWVAVGGRYEDAGSNGIFHFLEHMAFKGSAKYSGREIKESIEGKGGILNAFTSEEYCCFLVKVAARHFPRALDILADMVQHPRLKAADVEKERQVIFEEIKMYHDLPQHQVEEMFNVLLWPDQPLGRPLEGTAETVGSLNRDRLAECRRDFFTAENVVVAAAGAVGREQVIARVRERFAGISPGERNRFAGARDGRDGSRLRVIGKSTEQTHLCLGVHGLPREHPDRYAIGLLGIVLGGNTSSRLFQRVREEKALAYEIASNVIRLIDTGAFVVFAGVDNRKAVTAVEIVLDEIERLKRRPVGGDEFRRAKEFYGGQLLLAMEDTLNQMLWLGEDEITVRRVYAPAEILAGVEKVRPEDLRRVARTIFAGGRLNLAMIGPVKDRERSRMKRLLAR